VFSTWYVGIEAFYKTTSNAQKAYATDRAKDGAVAFAFKISGHKHTFEATTAAERDGWFVAVEKAITEAKASKDTIESSEGYKEHKEKIGTFALCSRRVALRSH
jgi:hypothetical protein